MPKIETPPFRDSPQFLPTVPLIASRMWGNRTYSGRDSHFMEDISHELYRDDLEPAAVARVSGRSGSGYTVKTITGAFQGSIFDPVVPGDDRYQFSAFDWASAAATYQHAEDPAVWIW